MQIYAHHNDWKIDFKIKHIIKYHKYLCINISLSYLYCSYLTKRFIHRTIQYCKYSNVKFAIWWNSNLLQLKQLKHFHEQFPDNSHKTSKSTTYFLMHFQKKKKDYFSEYKWSIQRMNDFYLHGILTLPTTINQSLSWHRRISIFYRYQTKGTKLSVHEKGVPPKLLSQVSWKWFAATRSMRFCTFSCQYIDKSFWRVERKFFSEPTATVVQRQRKRWIYRPPFVRPYPRCFSFSFYFFPPLPLPFILYRLPRISFRCSRGVWKINGCVRFTVHTLFSWKIYRWLSC